MKKHNYHIVFCFLVAIGILFLVLSCGSRKTEKSLEKLESKSFANSNFLEFQYNISLMNKGEFKPYDNSKPMIIGGIAYYNTSLTFDKSILQKNSKKQGNNLSYDSDNLFKKVKQTEKKDNSNLWIGLFAVLGLLFVLYLTLKKI